MRPFKPAWWLRSAHLQSCFPTFFGTQCKHALRWEELSLPDGDFIDLVWAGEADAPIVILLPGLEGSLRSNYIRTQMNSLVSGGWQVVVMHYRSCSGRINRLPRSYNSLDFQDLSYLIEQLEERLPILPISVVGFSLGGNILLHYLRHNPKSPIRSAVTVSTPYEMGRTADHMPMLYQNFLLRSMKNKAIKKNQSGMKMPASIEEIRRIKTIRQFDDLITAPFYQYASAEDYYQAASCRTKLKDIHYPTLMLHALDDPFIPKDSVPEKNELSVEFSQELYPHGGHLGFIGGSLPGRPIYWLGSRITTFLREPLLQHCL